MRAGILFNPGAGGAFAFPAIGEALLTCFGADATLTCAASLGENWLPGVPALPFVQAEYPLAEYPQAEYPQAEYPQGLPFIPRLRRAVSILVEAGIDLLVCVGGDGFAAYCAEALILAGSRIPLMGVAGGTANVGPLLRFDVAKLAGLRPADLRFSTVNALECSCVDPGESRGGGGARQVLGLAFNDIVVGDTFLGTLDGRMVNLGAREFLETGRKVEKTPSRSPASALFGVRLNGEELHAERIPVQIVASPIHEAEFYHGKAVTGALCVASWQGGAGVLALCDRVWVSMDARASGFCGIEHLILSAGDSVELFGLTKDGQVIIDGNPFLRTKDIVEIRCRPEAITIASLTNRGLSI